MSSPFTKIHVLVLRDDLSLPGSEGLSTETVAELLAAETRLRVTSARAGYGEGTRTAEKLKPDLIIVDRVLGDPVGLVAELDEVLQRLPILVILDEAERDRVHECVLAGARGALVRPLDPNVLARTIFQVHERAARRRRQWLAELEASGRKPQGGRLIAVRGTKGGVGATSIAINLATSIKHQTGLRVALIDAHFFGGDVPVALNLVPNGSIEDILPHLHMLDDELIERTLVHHESGVDLLAAPAAFESAEAIKADDLQQVIEAIRARYDFVVVDCSPFLDQNTLTAMDMSEILLVVSTPELVALKNAARLIQLGADLGYSESKLRLIINRQGCPGSVARADFERHLAHPMSFAIPNDGAVAKAFLQGDTLRAYNRRSRATRAIDRLAKVVIANQGWDGETVPGRRPGRLRLPTLPSIPHPKIPRPKILGSGTEHAS